MMKSIKMTHERKAATNFQSVILQFRQASKLKSLEMVYDSPIWTDPVEPWIQDSLKWNPENLLALQACLV